MNINKQSDAFGAKVASSAKQQTGLGAASSAPKYARLFTAFLVIVALLIALVALGLQQRDVELVALNRKLAAYRQLQNGIATQLYNLASALESPDQESLDTAQRQINLLSYDLDRVKYVAPDEADLLAKLAVDHGQFVNVMTQAVEMAQSGQVSQARELQLEKATPLADRLDRTTNELANRAEADMVARIDQNRAAYDTSLWALIGLAGVSVALALILGRMAGKEGRVDGVQHPG